MKESTSIRLDKHDRANVKIAKELCAKQTFRPLANITLSDAVRFALAYLANTTKRGAE